MIYINQEGECELSRGRTVAEAVKKAQSYGHEIAIIEVNRPDEKRADGDVYWTTEKITDYNL